jgi:hypothetical protein
MFSLKYLDTIVRSDQERNAIPIYSILQTRNLATTANNIAGTTKNNSFFF